MADRFDKFTERARRVLTLAQEEAQRFNHNYIGTEHLLLGILREERSVAASILMEKGMRLHTVREDIVQLLNEKSSVTRVKETPLLAEFSRDLTDAAMRNQLDPLVGRGDFLVNLSVDVSSIALIKYCWEKGAMYLDTCIEPWAGGYTDPGMPAARRTNYALREEALALHATGRPGKLATLLTKPLTTARDLTVLARAQRELGAQLPADGFEHLAFYNPAYRRIEMHLRATRALSLQLDDLQGPNGLAFSPDGRTLYVIESRARPHRRSRR